MDSVIALKLAGAFAAAFVAGGINSVAGGGTMISFPALVGLGLSEKVSNATNCLGILPGSAGSMWGFRREMARVPGRFYWLLIPATLGGIGGATLLKYTSDSTFRWIVPWLLLFATVLFIVQAPIRKRLEAWIAGKSGGSPDAAAGQMQWLAIASVLQFIVGVYGGYFGAGMSIMMLAVLGVVGMTDILEMNAMTSLLAGGINGVAGILFAFAHLIAWPYVAVMAPGAILGGWLAAGVARKIGKVLIRRFVILVGVTIAAVMFWRVLR